MMVRMTARRSLSRFFVAFATLVVALGLAAPARAQGASSPSTMVVYGVSAGGGQRRTSGVFDPAQLPAGAPQPAGYKTIGTLGFTGGVKFEDRVAVMGLWDQSFGGNTTGHWGTSDFHAVLRLWVTSAVWVEGGGGASEMAYKGDPNTSVAVNRFWAPGGEVAAGLDVFHTKHTALSILGRVTMANFNGLATNTFSLQVGLMGMH
jgi:hypothetical protein